MEQQANEIPLFPLSTFLLPGEEIPLKIFEPRYIQLISECEKSSKPFGIPFIEKGDITRYGSEVEIQSIIAKNSLNEMVILVKGVRNFHLIDFYNELPGKLYGGGIIEYIDDKFLSTNPELAVLVKKLKLNIDTTLGTLVIEGYMNLMDIAKSIMLNSDEKFTFYSYRNLYQMERFLIRKLKFLELIKKQEESLQNNFSLN
jgi:uncharacterized protein